MNKLFPLLIACAVLSGCAATARDEGVQFMAPTGLSDIYSRTSMEVMLAITPNSDSACAGSECDRRAEFDQRVTRIGAKLADAAYRSYPALAERIPRFQFNVIDKAEPGTASAAGGYIAVLRPVSAIAVSDEALSFVIGRELGHVIAQHHERNTATSLAISVVASALAPVVGVAKLLAVLYSGSTSAMAASSLTSAASFASSRVVIESYWPRQRQEADAIALQLIAKVGYDARAIATGFAPDCPQGPLTRWARELQESVALLAAPAAVREAPRTEQAAAPAQPVSAVE